MVFHMIDIYAIYQIQDQEDWLIMTWSLIQVALAVYAVVLAFGSVALKVVLLYAKLYVRIVIMFYLAISIGMFIISLMIGLAASTKATRTTALMSLLY